MPIFLTGTDIGAGAALRGYTVGAVDYITKPLRPVGEACGGLYPGGCAVCTGVSHALSRVVCGLRA
ncbi:hypothetical protein ACIBHX_16505 [Nonomuraea sp. NPDC050536]|uniref:hypothetical protein n=1 Tax=Nonomuraea sp. NPDC050536 TaxID=3364366 RepID=UPI0037C73E25